MNTRKFEAMESMYRWTGNSVIQNLILWIFVLLVAFAIIHGPWMIKVGVVLFLSIPIYINNLKIQPFFYRKNKMKWMLVFLINISVFAGIGGTLICYTVNEYTLKAYYTSFGVLLLVVSFGGAFKMAKDGFIRRQQIKDAELNLLKAQINPHFLFNTLNNLYGLSVTKSDKLPDLMLKLSNLLRYSLYETHQMLVPLEKEIDYLVNYIELERIRLEDDTKIDFHVNEYPLDFKIAPMLLIAFIENAFKYVRTNFNGEKYVTIELKVNNGELTFLCINSLNSGSTDSNIETFEGGIGLVNTKKQLEFIYTDTHLLKEENQLNEYRVDLKLRGL